MEESDAGKEEDLYELVRAALQEKFMAKGSCRLDLTAREISEEVEKRSAVEILSYLRSEKMCPDMVGYLELKGLLFKNVRRIVVDVKREQLTLPDVYKLKMYAEVLDVYYAFLISPNGFREEQKRIMMYHSDTLAFYSFFHRGEISVMCFIEGVLNLDEELCKKNPFAFEFGYKRVKPQE